VRPGTTWTVCAALGRFGMSISASCMEDMMDPLGFQTASGEVVMRLLVTGKS
jgi:hypothetical protein